MGRKRDDDINLASTARLAFALNKLGHEFSIERPPAASGQPAGRTPYAQHAAWVAHFAAQPAYSNRPTSQTVCNIEQSHYTADTGGPIHKDQVLTVVIDENRYCSHCSASEPCARLHIFNCHLEFQGPRLDKSVGRANGLTQFSAVTPTVSFYYYQPLLSLAAD
jgi:hypothetical protein